MPPPLHSIPSFKATNVALVGQQIDHSVPLWVQPKFALVTIASCPGKNTHPYTPHPRTHTRASPVQGKNTAVPYAPPRSFLLGSAICDGCARRTCRPITISFPSLVSNSLLFIYLTASSPHLFGRLVPVCFPLPKVACAGAGKILHFACLNLQLYLCILFYRDSLSNFLYATSFLLLRRIHMTYSPCHSCLTSCRLPAASKLVLAVIALSILTPVASSRCCCTNGRVRGNTKTASRISATEPDFA